MLRTVVLGSLSSALLWGAIGGLVWLTHYY
jgi:hypothetical protein